MHRSPRDDIETVIVSEDDLQAAVDSLAERLTEDVADYHPLFVGVLTGAFVFLADLIRRLDFPLEVDFIAASSYGEDTEAGELEITSEVECDLTDRHVVIVDDILDTGQTLQALERVVRRRGAASVRTCCLLDKPDRRTCDFEADYVGIKIPDRFVVGYGLDFAGGHRHLPFVGVLRSELYSSH